MINFLITIIISLLLSAQYAEANPSSNGSTGLLKLPAADTLDSGNICIGSWCDFTKRGGENLTMMPLSITMGIGSFWEIYGSYPSILLNNDEEKGGNDGAALIGMKFRFGTKRSDPVKSALSIYSRRHLSASDRRIEGVSDTGLILIHSIREEKYALHFNAGYSKNGDPKEVSGLSSLPGFKDQLSTGAAAEFFLSQRSKTTIEIQSETPREKGNSAGLELTAGYQYFITPHLTLNSALSTSVGGDFPDLRILVGFSTCQGVGTYIKPVPQLIKDRDAKKGVVAKPSKVVPLSPLLMKSPSPVMMSKLEVPLEADQEEILIKPYGKVGVSTLLATSPVVLPPSIVLDAVKIANPAKIAQLQGARIEEKALEYTQARMSGASPLYGVTYKEEKVTPASAEELSPPKSMSVFRKFRFPDVIFEFASIELSDEVKKSLSELAEIIRKDTKWKYIRIDGHTDSIGSVKYNMELSLRRAISVANYLVSREGLNPSRIFVKGLGKSHPIDDNSTDAGRGKNRRFEVLFLVDK